MRFARWTIACMVALVSALVPLHVAHASETHEIPLVMIVIGFDGGSDPDAAVPYDEGYDWSAALFGQGESPASYYRDISQGAFAFTPAKETSAMGIDGNYNTADHANDGIVHVTLHQPHGNWGPVNVDRAVTKDFAQMVMQALSASEAFIDFAAYDANGDGTVSQQELAVCVCVAGYEASPITDFHRTDIPLLWAHAGLLDAIAIDPKTASGLRFETYIAIAERYWEENAPAETIEQEPLGIIYHELGHALGLPDLYAVKHTEGPWADWRVGALSLMDEGGWQYADDGAGWRNIPTSLDAWSRYVLGWTSPTVVTHSGDYAVSSQLSNGGYAALIIPTSEPDQYFLVENRQAESHDISLSPDYLESGALVVWHIDNNMYRRYYNANEVNDADHHPAIIAEDESGQTSTELMLYNSGNDTPEAMKPAGITLQFDPNPGRETTVHVEMDDKAGVLNALHLRDDAAREQLSMATNEPELLLERITSTMRILVT